jgi:hypothetical protein
VPLTRLAFVERVKNGVEGIGVGTYDYSATMGSTGRLKCLHRLGSIEDYPDDPTVPASALGGRSALSVLARSQASYWIGQVHPQLAPYPYRWSWYLSSPSTVSDGETRYSSAGGGNLIRDNGDGTFTTVQAASEYYSELDQYLMGLRGPDEVGDIFFVTGTDGTRLVAEPEPGVTFRGARVDVSIDDVVASNGPRTPDVPSSQKEFRAAFVLLTRPGADVSQVTIDRLERLRLAWEEYFSRAVDGRGSMTTSILPK